MRSTVKSRSGRNLNLRARWSSLILIALVLIVSGFSCRRLVEVPSDRRLNDHTDNPLVPEGYYLISKGYYEEIQKTLIACESLLLLGEGQLATTTDTSR